MGTAGSLSARRARAQIMPILYAGALASVCPRNVVREPSYVLLDQASLRCCQSSPVHTQLLMPLRALQLLRYSFGSGYCNLAPVESLRLAIPPLPVQTSDPGPPATISALTVKRRPELQPHSAPPIQSVTDVARFIAPGRPELEHQVHH